MKERYDLILQREIENDGQTVHVYFEPMIGLYMAFGFSAYYATMATNALLSISYELDMPVALITKQQLMELRQSM